MKVRDIASVIEETAPLVIQENYDNSGLLVGNPDTEISSALLCVDVTEEVMDEAEELGAGMIISHHPVIFHPLKRLTGSNYIQRVVERAVRKGIAIYACHTNLDDVGGGMSFRLASEIGIKNPKFLVSGQDKPDTGIGIVGELDKPVPAEDYLKSMMSNLGLKVIRHSDLNRRSVGRVAVCTGSGASFIDAAVIAEADLYVTADLKYNDFFNTADRMIVADIGHFESEYCAIDMLYDIITKKISTFALHKSKRSRNPVNYLV